jgi:hypothetical protein
MWAHFYLRNPKSPANFVPAFADDMPGDSESEIKMMEWMRWLGDCKALAALKAMVLPI